jgi:hypothetical protein
MSKTHIASDESLQEIKQAIAGSALAYTGDARTAALATGDPDTIDRYYNSVARQVKTRQEMNLLFIDWWTANWNDVTSTYNGMLWRWFDTILEDSRVHGVVFPLFGVSTTAIGELTDDSVGLVCTPSTAASAEQDDFAGLPQFWCVEVAAEKHEDGTHTIYACQYIDDDDFVRKSGHLVWVLQKNTYTRERDEYGCRIFKMRCHKSGGYTTWPQGTDRNGTVYPYIANPKYAAGMQEDGSISCESGLRPVNFKNHNDNVKLWRARGSQYAGASGALLKWQLRMMWLKYARKGNSGTIEGCSSYNCQYKAAFSAQGVTYFPVTMAQMANLLVDSWVEIGTHTGTSQDRGSADMRDIACEVQITHIDKITVESTEYAAVYVDVAQPFDVVADQTMLSTMPYGSGWNDTVQGNDGSRYSCTSGKEPGLIQKTEFQPGAYMIVADELWQWGQNEAGDFTLDVYTCHDQSKVTTNGSISADYTKQEDLTLTFPFDTKSSWQYIEDTAISADPAVLWPAAVSNRAGSGTGVKAGFGVSPAASGVRAAWRCCNLNNGGNCSLAAANSNNGPSNANWNGLAGAQLVQKNHHTLRCTFLAYCENFLKPAAGARVRKQARPGLRDKELDRRLVA